MIHSFNRMPRWGQGALMYSYQWCTQHLMWAKIWQRMGVCSLQAGIVLRLNCMTKRRTCPEDTTSHQIFLRWKRTSETHSEGCVLTKTSFRSKLNYVQRALIKINVSTNPYSIKKIAEPPFYKSPWGSGLKTPVTDWFFLCNDPSFQFSNKMFPNSLMWHYAPGTKSWMLSAEQPSATYQRHQGSN